VSILEDAGIKSTRARIVIGLFVVLFSASLIFASIAFISAGNANKDNDENTAGIARAASAVDRLSKCTADWEKDYVLAQSERLPNSINKDNAYLGLLEDLRPIIAATIPSEQNRVKALAALDTAITKAKTLQGVQFDVAYPNYYCTNQGRVIVPRKMLDPQPEGTVAP